MDWYTFEGSVYSTSTAQCLPLAIGLYRVPVTLLGLEPVDRSITMRPWKVY